MHTKFVKDSDNIQLNKMFAFDTLFNNFFYQEQKMLISLYQNIKFSIIDAKSQIVVNSHCK